MTEETPVVAGEESEALEEDAPDGGEEGVGGEESSIEGAGSEESVGPGGLTTEVSQVRTSIRAAIRKHAFPILTGVLVLTIFVIFRKIILPFIFAVIVVYLMEPIVNRLSTRKAGSRVPFALPRWLSVILVYATFLGVISLGAFMVLPRVVTEGISVVRTLPMMFQSLHEEHLPKWDSTIQSYIHDYFPDASSSDHEAVGPRLKVDEARKRAFVVSYQTARRIQEEESQQEEAKGIAGRVAKSKVMVAADDAYQRTEEGEEPQEKGGKEEKRGKEEKGEEGAEGGTIEGGEEEVQRRLREEKEAALQKIRAAEAGAREALHRAAAEGGAAIDLEYEDIMLQVFGEEAGGWRYDTHGASTGVRVVNASAGEIEVFAPDFEFEVEALDDSRWLIRNRMSREVEVVNVAPQIFSLQETLDSALVDFTEFSNVQVTALVNFLKNIVMGIIGGFVAMILTLMVAAFLSIDLPRVLSYIRTLVPEEGRSGYDVLLKRIDRGVSGVIRGQLLICLVNGTLTYIGLSFLGVKFALLLGVTAGTLSLVPVFGTIISTVPIVLFALTGGFMKGLLSLAWILFIHFVEANVLNPKIIGKSAEIHPVLVIFALLAGESAFGIIGALLAVPTASICITLYEFLRTRAWRQIETPVGVETGELGDEVAA